MNTQRGGDHIDERGTTLFARIRIAVAATVLLLLGVVGTTTTAEAESPACETRVNNTVDKLLECVTIEGVRAHQAAFQAAADANDGNRAAGTGGYDDTVAYVVETLEAAGYDVELNGFPFTFVPL
ncbi:MAG: hypothetical protein OER95_04535, partial [Acidimicrobiia bacterium]|nr:hypothetical protein [Acidimicrobiia bacterium]